MSHPIPATRSLSCLTLSRRLRGTFLLALLAASGTASAFGQAAGYHLVKIVDDYTRRPDDLTKYFTFSGGFSTTPTLDNGKVVFRPYPSQDSIWVANVDGSGLTRLAGLNTPAPGGMGDFEQFGGGNSGGLPLVKDGVVVFTGESPAADPNGFNYGLYSVPVTGGAPTRIADRSTPLPGGATGETFSTFGNYNAESNNFSVSNGKVAFDGAGTSGTSGVYFAGTDGSGLVTLADGNHPVPVNGGASVNNFFTPALYQGTTIFYGTTTFDPSTGFNALFSTTGSFNYKEIANSDHTLPGNPDASPHTRFDVPPLAFAGTRVAFLADDTDSTATNGYRGLYTVPVGGGAFMAIIDSRTTSLPGTTAAPFKVQSFALYNGVLAISVADNDNNTFIYLKAADGNGVFTKLIGTGDTVDGGNGVASGVGLVPGGFDGTNIGIQIYYAANEPDYFAYSGVYVLVPGPLPKPAIDSPLTASAKQGVSFIYQLRATNSPGHFGVLGLPASLTLDKMTGVLSGTPENPGTLTLTLQAFNGTGEGTATLNITVVAQLPVITSATTATAQVGQAFSYQIAATNSPTSYGVLGLRPGLSVDSKTGLISGTPTGSGTFTLTLKATNRAGTSSQNLKLTIKPSTPVITSPDTATATVGKPFTYQIKATSSPTGYGVLGLFNGITVNQQTGLISGTSTVSGTHTLTLQATNAGGTGTKALTLTVNAK